MLCHAAAIGPSPCAVASPITRGMLADCGTRSTRLGMLSVGCPGGSSGSLAGGSDGSATAPLLRRRTPAWIMGGRTTTVSRGRSMHAAVVRQFDHPPRYETFDPPVPLGDHDELVEVLASGLHPRVRSQANGSHYTSTDELPLVPGIDGVGRRSTDRSCTSSSLTPPTAPWPSAPSSTLAAASRFPPVPTPSCWRPR